MEQKIARYDQLGAEAYPGPLPGTKEAALGVLSRAVRRIGRVREAANGAIARALRRLRG